MKIYSRVVIDIATGKVVDADIWDEDYRGPIAECKGGGTSVSHSTSTPDYAFNARMATVAEKQQAQADEFMSYWREHYQPMEKAQIAANMEIIPEQLKTEKMKHDVQREQMGATQELIPLEKEYRRGVLEAGIEETAAARPVMAEYYKEALRGIDPDREVALARTDVATQFKGEEGALRRSLGRVGLGSRFGEAMAGRGYERARATAGAMTGARRIAEEQKFSRLSGAARQFKGGLMR